MALSRRIAKRRAVNAATAAVAGIVVVIVAAIGGYAAITSGGAGKTITVTSTAPPSFSTVTSTATTTSISTSIATTTSTQTGTNVTTTATTTATVAPTVSVILNGAGATFPFPLLSSMISTYQQANPAVQVNYQAIGSGGGIAALEGKTVDFAASDAPLGAADRAKAPNSLHIPETIGAVTIAYNVPSVPTGLHLTGKVIADIFAGNVTTWNDPEIQSLNANTTLPAKSILVVHRSDGSGTTFIFTGYLSASSPAWKTAIGQGKSVAWPVGLGANGNQGVAGVIQGTQYTMGYVELAYALQNKMTVANVQNPAGNWIAPSLNSIALAVQSAASGGLPSGDQSWSSVSLLNAPDPGAYPIVSFTYLLVYKDLSVIPGMTKDRATALVQFLWWVIHDGQKLSPSLAYVPLPQNVVTIDETTLKSITFNGQALLS